MAGENAHIFTSADEEPVKPSLAAARLDEVVHCLGD